MEGFMKKIVFFAIFTSLAIYSFAFDNSLKGSWGLISDGGREKTEIIRFGNDEIMILDTRFRKGEYEENVDFISIENESGYQITLQYYKLAYNKLLYILTESESDEDSSPNSTTLILTKF
jgi:hypothetical protein